MSNPRAKENLKNFKKGESGNPNGRPKALKTVLKQIDAESKAKVFAILNQAILSKNKDEARRLLENADVGEYGFVMQIAIKELFGKNGWKALNDILDRLFGRPVQQTDVTSNGKDILTNIQVEIIDPKNE